MKKQQYLSFSLLVAALVMLPQCEWPKGCCETRDDSSCTVPTTAGSVDRKANLDDSSEILATANNEPLVTVQEFDGYLGDILEAQPQYKQIVQMMPDAEKQIFEGMLNERVIAHWASEQNLDRNAAYQKERAKMYDFVDRSLAIKYFQNAHPATVSKSEVKKFYDENKATMPELAGSSGVNAQAVIFENKPDAQVFYDKVKNNMTDFAKEAKDANLVVKSLDMVSEQSIDVEEPIRIELAATKKFPSVALIELGDGNFAVVKAIAKKDEKYRPFEQVEADIEKFMKNQKSVETLTKEIEKLKKDYNIKVNTDYFDRKKKTSQPAMTPQMFQEQMKEVHEPAGRVQGA